MPETHSSYPVAVRWRSGREGVATSADGQPELAVASPPAFGGPAGVWTPEHLFVLAAATCWMTTFLSVAELSKLDFAAVEADGEGVLERGDDRKYHIARITLRPRVTIRREADRERALRLIEKAENACLIRNSMRSEISLEPEVLAAPELVAAGERPE
jgi:peroxiredoxin-like protein